MTVLLAAALGLCACAPSPATCDAGQASQPPPPNAQGAWKGTYECNNTVQKLSAALAENDDGQIDGEMFLDYTIMILGQPFTLTGRSNIDDGSVQAGACAAFVDVLDNSQGLPDWELSLGLNADGDELAGEFWRINGAGDTATCPIELDRIIVRDVVNNDPVDGG